ncbi:MAG: hypothetical protein ABIT36_01180 [Steroidobacteraceae bacterium]
MIGRIDFDAINLFDTTRAEENTSLFRLANRAHISTREHTVEKQLLFKSGDVYDSRLLEESERILRTTRYLLDAHIRPVAYHDGIVDIEVTTQDVWTFNPSVTFGRKGGVNSSGFELQELNLLGLGTQLGVGFKSNVDRDSKFIQYRDRHVGSSWWEVAGRYANNSDGRLTELAAQHPFYALDTRRAGGVVLSDDQRIDSRYDLGEITDQYATHAKLATAWWGASNGLRDGWTRRWSLGITRDEHTFDTLANTLLTPADRRLTYPWVAAEWLQDDFHTERNRDQIDRTEDYSLGWHVRTQVGYASSSLGSDRNAVVFQGSATKGMRLSDRQTVLLDAYTDGRYERGGFAGTQTGGQLRWYLRESPKHLSFMTISADVGSRLDTDQQILLGGETGLRGYPLRYQNGKGRWLFTAEQRYFSDWFPFRLVNVGAAAFFDAGGTWGGSSQGKLEDFGLGLRLGGNRSAEGNVVHVDLAYPLDGDRSVKKLQLTIETRHRF